MALMNFKIDQAGSFAAVAFLSCTPKTAFGSDVQETTRDGMRKWVIELIVSAYGFGGKTSNEVLKVGVASYEDPAKDLATFTPVQLVGFEVGVMDKTKRMPDGTEKTMGAQVYFRAESIRPLAATAPATPSKAA